MNNDRITVVKRGYTFGSMLAFGLSLVYHKSILIALIHSIFSWVYVIFRLFQGDIDVSIF